MRYLRSIEQGAAADVHRFFPEWADRPPARGELHECERNSYLAGGYAEEFGYRARGPASLALYPAESDLEWRVQIGALHPGYPECARPIDREAVPDETSRPGVRTLHPMTGARPLPIRSIVVGVSAKGGRRFPRSERAPSAWRELLVLRRNLLRGR